MKKFSLITALFALFLTALTAIPQQTMAGGVVVTSHPVSVSHVSASTTTHASTPTATHTTTPTTVHETAPTVTKTSSTTVTKPTKTSSTGSKTEAEIKQNQQVNENRQQRRSGNTTSTYVPVNSGNQAVLKQGYTGKKDTTSKR